MHICVRTPNAHIITLNVEPSITVLALKEKIGDAEGTLPLLQALVRGVVELDDAQTLAYYSLGEGSTIDLVYCPIEPLEPFRRTIGVHVNMGECRVASLAVEPYDTVASVKALIQHCIGTASSQFWLHSAGQRLEEDGRCLADCEIKDDSTMYIVMRLTNSGASVRKEIMQIFAKLPNSKIITLSASPSHTIANVKAMICAAEGIQPEQQTLALGLRRLEDGRTLAECQIHEDTVILVIAGPV